MEAPPAVVQRTHPEGPGNGALTDTQLGMIGAGEQGTEGSYEGGLQIDGLIFGGVRAGIRQALESGMQCGVDDVNTSEVGTVSGVAEKGSGNGRDVSRPPPAERTSRRLRPGPRVGGTIIARRRRPCSDAELRRHLRPGGRSHVVIAGHVLALGRQSEHSMYEKLVLRSMWNRAEPVKQTGDDGGDMTDGNVGPDGEPLAPRIRSCQGVETTKAKLEALGIDGGHGSRRMCRHVGVGQGELGMKASILGVDGSDGLLLRSQLLLLSKHGTLVRQQLLLSSKLAAGGIQLLLDKGRRRRSDAGGSGCAAGRRRRAVGGRDTTGRPAGADGIDVVVGADGGGGTAGPRPKRRLEGRIGRSGSQPVRPSVGTRREGVGLGGRHAGGDRRTRFAQDYNCATC